MWDLATLDYLNQRIGRRARKKRSAPFVPDGTESVDNWPSLPNLGRYEPPGWEPVHSWFVDKTGWGCRDEPALTIDQFKVDLHRYMASHPGHGFGITEEGEFQLHVSAFRLRAA